MLKRFAEYYPAEPDSGLLSQLDTERYPILAAALREEGNDGLAREVMSLLKERRRAPRRTLELLVRLDHPTFQLTARIEDLSETGIRLRLLRRKPLDLMACDRLRLRCHVMSDELSEGAALDIHVALVRVAHMDDQAVELGFRFLHVSPEQARVLHLLQRAYFFS